MIGAVAMVQFTDALESGRERDASDVHLVPGLPPVLRIDGRLHETRDPVLTPEALVSISERLLPAERLAELRSSGDLTVTLANRVFGSIRVHVYLAEGGVVIAARLLGRTIPSLESLALPDAMNFLAKFERGLVLVSGPTGSGKSTTLAALVKHMSSIGARRIVTIEDPIEYRHESGRCIVTQRELHSDTPDLATALRGALRADPDVIVVGEMRDAAAMGAALAAAETGHLVLGTLHTGDAPQTIDRVIDAFEGAHQSQVRAQLAQVLVAVACQHLVPRACGSGRRAIVELLFGNDAVRNLIREGKTHQLRNAIATGRRDGMQTFEQHAIELLRNREIDDVEARRFRTPSETRA